MNIIDTIHEKFSIAAWEKHKQKRYGLKGCKIIADPYYLQDLKDMYEFMFEREECEEATACDCDIEKISEMIKTI